MKRKINVIICFVLLIFNETYGQDRIINIAIMPFTSPVPHNETVTKDVQEELATCFLKSRFHLIDRNITDKLKKELDAAKDDALLYSKVVTEEGHILNAEYIITGVVDTIAYGGTISKDFPSTNIKKSLDATAKYTKFHGTVHLALEIYKVETGQVIYSHPYIVTSRDFDGDAKAALIENVMCRLRNEIQIDVRKLFPAVMQLISIEKTKKNGLPQTILINGGSEVFDSGKQEVVCPGDDEISIASKTSAVGSIFKNPKGAINSSKTILNVFNPYEVIIGGKILRREKLIGKVRVLSIENDVTVCTVIDGEEDIKNYMNDKKPLFVKTENTGERIIGEAIEYNVTYPDWSFPSNYKEYQIKNPYVFEKHLMNILNEKCKLGYHKFQEEDKTVVISPFTFFYFDRKNNINGEIAYFISYPIKNKTQFRIGFKSRENKPQDTEYRDASKYILDASEENIKLMIDQINK